MKSNTYIIINIIFLALSHETQYLILFGENEYKYTQVSNIRSCDIY